MIDYNTLITKENLENAFKFFDKDKSGFLNVEEIKHIFSTNNSEEKKLILEKARELRAQGMLKKDIFKIFGLGEHFFRSLK